MENCTIAFIGCGNMSRSLIGGLIANGTKPEQLIAADPDNDQRLSLSGQFGIETRIDNTDVVMEADVVVLAVKPQIMHGVVSELADPLKESSKLISIFLDTILIASEIQFCVAPLFTSNCITLNNSSHPI